MPHLFHRTMQFAAAVILAVAAGQAIADDAVVVASTVPGYQPGMVVSSADRLSLPDGASATLLFQSGGMLRLRGPFEGTLTDPQSQETETSVVRLADLFRLHGVDATVIGGTRSTGGRTLTPGRLEDVQVDPQRSGTYCIDAASSIWISRPTADRGSYVVRRKGTSRMLAWPAGSERVEWPADIPVEDGSQFEIAAGSSGRSTVTFRMMPTALPSRAAMVAKAMVLGCHNQFDEDLVRVSRSSVDPELWISTDRGRQPVFKPGEPISLTVVSDVDGYLYCVAMTGSGVMPIFPGAAIDGAQVRGSMPLSIPGRRQPTGLAAVAGLDQIRCWLADRDISPELPHALLGSQSGRLPDQLSHDVSALFARIGGPRTATDAIAIRIDQPRP